MKGHLADPTHLTKADFEAFLSYDPESGFFHWKVKSGRQAAGSRAGSLSGRYSVICVCGVRVYAHRLAYFWMTGVWPDGIVDHKDLSRHNNAWSNLRLANHSLNGANSLPRNSLKGVRQTKYGRFQSRIKIKGQGLHLGNFPTSDEAATAYRRAASDAFGEFARSN